MLIKNYYCIQEREGGGEGENIDIIIMKYYLKFLIIVLYSLQDKKCN